MDNSFLGDELLNKKGSSSPTTKRRHASLSVPKKIARSALANVNFTDNGDKPPSSGGCPLSPTPLQKHLTQEDLLKGTRALPTLLLLLHCVHCTFSLFRLDLLL
jgi:hypothetical protein